DVVYFSEWHLGRVLAAWRRVSRQSFALVLCNGGLTPGPYDHLDRVQQLVPGAIEYTVGRGESPDRQEVLPLGVAMEASPRLPSEGERADLRRRLGLATGRLVEAHSHGLPCLAHAHPVMEWVLGEECDTADLRDAGAVASWLGDLPADALAPEHRRRRHGLAYERFSWAMLADRYVQLLRGAA